MNYSQIASYVDRTTAALEKNDQESVIVICDCSKPREIILNHEEVIRANRIKNAKASLLFTSSRSILRSVLGEFLGVAPRSVEICYGSFGKPFLSTKYNVRIQFNVSHAGEVAVIGIGRFGPIGVDVEINSLCKLSEIASYFLHQEEIEYIASLPHESVENKLLDLWTAKEALLKSIGIGLRIDPRSVIVNLDEFPYAQGYIGKSSQRRYVRWLLQSSNMQIAVSVAKGMRLTVFHDTNLMRLPSQEGIIWMNS